MKLQITSFGWACAASILFWIIVIFAVMSLASCGGTLTIRPDGSISYQTPEILKPRIVPEK